MGCSSSKDMLAVYDSTTFQRRADTVRIDGERGYASEITRDENGS